MKIVIYGDSITAGYERLTPDLARISPILKIMLEHKLNQEHQVLLRGVCGENTDEALLRLDSIVNLKANMNVIFFGANDAKFGSSVSPEKFYKNLQIMVENLGIDRVLLVGPPYHNDKVENEKRDNQRIEEYVQAEQQLVADFGLEFINLYEEMAADNSYLQADGLHFSEKGYELLTDRLVSAIKNFDR